MFSKTDRTMLENLTVEVSRLKEQRGADQARIDELTAGVIAATHSAEAVERVASGASTRVLRTSEALRELEADVEELDAALGARLALDGELFDALRGVRDYVVSTQQIIHGFALDLENVAAFASHLSDGVEEVQEIVNYNAQEARNVYALLGLDIVDDEEGMPGGVILPTVPQGANILEEVEALGLELGELIAEREIQADEAALAAATSTPTDPTFFDTLYEAYRLSAGRPLSAPDFKHALAEAGLYVVPA